MTAKVIFTDPHIRVKDVARAAEWYRRVLGLQIEMAMPDKKHPAFVRMNAGDPAGVAIMISDGSDTMSGKKTPQAITDAITSRKAQKVVDIYFRVDSDIDKLLASVKRKGVKVKGPVNQPYGMREFQLRDPDGYLVTVGQELPQQPPLV